MSDDRILLEWAQGAARRMVGTVILRDDKSAAINQAQTILKELSSVSPVHQEAGLMVLLAELATIAGALSIVAAGFKSRNLGKQVGPAELLEDVLTFRTQYAALDPLQQAQLLEKLRREFSDLP